MPKLERIERIYACKYCKSEGSYGEAKKCEAQGPPPEVLPRGTVFVGTSKEESPKEQWFIVRGLWCVSTRKHLNAYSGVSRHNSYTMFTPNRNGKKLVSSTPPVENSRRLNPSAIEKLCVQDEFFKSNYERIMGKDS